MQGSLAKRICLLTIVAMVVAIMAHGYAQAQSHRTAVDLIVICGEGGARTVVIDGRGNPVDPEACVAQLCLDCIAGGPPFFADGPDTARERTRASRIDMNGAGVGPSAQGWSAALPRGPPSEV